MSPGGFCHGALIALALAALHAGATPARVDAQTATISAGQTVTGTLAANDRRFEDGSYFDEYSFRGSRGDRLTITLRSSDFDAYLHFGRAVGGGFESLAADDDGDGGTDSRIEFTLPADGDYLIRANSLGAAETGRYTLIFQSMPAAGAAAAPVAARIAMGQTVSGALRRGDAELNDGSFINEWAFDGRGGERVIITMRSSAFDAFLHLGRRTASGFESLATDDDGGGGTDARIEFVLPADGAYVIRANSLSAGETGAYTLDLQSAATAVAAVATAVPAGLRPIQVCVVQNGALAEVTVGYNAATGDTIANGRAFRDVYGAPASYAVSHAWYVNSEPVAVGGRRYVKFGLPRLLGPSEVTPIGVVHGVPVFGESGSAHLDVVYLPVRYGCEFQPYQVEITGG